jgi:hypothetical protein
MADVKISGLPASTVPLAGTEVLPIVQGGATKQVSVNNLTAGKTVLAAAFDTDVAAAAVTLSGTTLAADGTDTNINLAITPKGSGGLGINGSPTGDLAGSTLTAKFCVKQDESGPVAGFVKANNSAATPGATVYGCRSRGTLAAPTIVQNNDVLATYLGLGFDGTDLAIAADIEFQVDGTPGSNDMPGRILFKTTPDGTQTPVEALRINSAQVATFAQAPVLTALTASTLLSLDASKNISSVTTSATTPLNGTEELAVIQSGSAKQVSVANLTAGRAVSAASLALTTSPLPTTSGGTALTSFTTNGVVHATSTSALTTNANLQFAGTKLSVGATASAWSGSSLDLGTATGLCAVAGTGGSFLTNNAYYDGSNWIYKVTNPASIYGLLANGTQNWSNAVSGSAGGTVTFVERMRIHPSGGVSVGDTTDPGAGNLRLGTGNLVIGTSGKGIDFSATAGTGTSELLSDYEEGTWTPGVSGDGGSAGSVAFTSVGYYTKVGRTVTLNGAVSFTNLGSWTGRVRITDIPFAANVVGCYGSAFITFATLANAFSVASATGTVSSTAITFPWSSDNGGGGDNIRFTDLAANSFIGFTLTYIV